MGINPGRNVGRVSIRVIPDTTKFRADLWKALNRIEKATHFTVNVDKANVDRRAVKASIERQMREMDGFAVHAKAIVDADMKELTEKAQKIPAVMDRLMLQRMKREIETTLRAVEVDLQPNIEDAAIRQTLDELGREFEYLSGRLADDIMSTEDAEALRHRLNEVKDKIDDVARNREARISVNPFTAWATGRLNFLTRPRMVEIFARVSKSSMVQVTATLAALSGARLGWKWIDDLAQKFRNLDRSLPSLIGWTTGITSLIGGLLAATGGLVSVGQGLFAILPAFLVLPGLLLNAIGSVTVLIVALKNASKELSPLKSDMNELGDIINETFWGRARQPIIGLVKTLMPQLRNAFRDLSEGVGDFTRAMAGSVERELGGGRLESIFKGIADGWRVLGTGSDAFAGAMVSLSQIAATYTPRLASWFVRQADAFDNWLKAIAEDGRLGRWMEDAIDSMYDVWDVTRGVAGVFEGLFRAAEAGGSGGLDSLADLMLRWEEVAKGDRFQVAASSLFRGANDAMGSFGDALRAAGKLVADMPGTFERFIRSSGDFFGGIFEESFNALNNPAFQRGMDKLSSGLGKALEGITPALKPLGVTFGNFVGLLGSLGENLLPAAADILAKLAPSIDSLIGSVEKVLPDLASAVEEISAELGPSLEGFIKEAGPMLGDVLLEVADLLVTIAPVISELLDMAKDLLGWVDDAEKNNSNWFADFEKFFTPDDQDWVVDTRIQFENQGLDFSGYAKSIPLKLETELDWVRMNNVTAEFKKHFDGLLDTKGQAAADAFVAEIEAANMPDAIKREILAGLGITSFTDPSQKTGAGIGGGIKTGLNSSIGDVIRAATDLANRTLGAVKGRTPEMTSAGRGGGAYFTTGLSSFIDRATAAGRRLANSAKSGASGAGSLYNVGSSMGAGLNRGLGSWTSNIVNTARGLVNRAINEARAAAEVNSPSKKMIRRVGSPLGEGVAVGIKRTTGQVAKASRDLIDVPASMSSAAHKAGRRAAGALAPTPGGAGGVNLHIHNPVVRDLQSEAWEAANLAGAVL